MKPILTLTVLFALIAGSCTACLLIFDVFDAARAGAFLLRVEAAILLLGLSSALIAWILRRSESAAGEPAA
jgi:hypothetical protein